MVRYKTLSFVCVVLWLFSVHNAFSIGVDPKSKRALRKTLKNYSESKKNMDDSAKKKNASSSGGKKSARGYSSEREKNSILYALPEPKAFESVIMVDVEDGDTIRVILDDSPYTVSLYGIDSPERTQSHGMKSAQAVTKMLNREKVRLQLYDKDRENRRCLAVVSVGEKNVNELLVKGGHAWVKKEYCYEPFCSDWISYQKKAREEKKGLWSSPEPIAPWVWRAMPPEQRYDLQQGYTPVANGLRSRYGKDTTIIGR